jgi:hypothetical protein
MADRVDPLDAEVRAALHAVHHRIAVSEFEADWAAARAVLHARRERPPPGAAFRYRPLTWAAAAALVLVGAGVVLRLSLSPDPGSRAGPPASADAASADAALPVMWYAPTDELLRVPSLGYTASPAALTVYDPIHLEVRP